MPKKQFQGIPQASLFERYLSYLLDVIILICVTSTVLSLLKIPPTFFILPILYSLGLKYLTYLSVRDLLIIYIVYTIFAIFYFVSEIYLKTSIGNRIFGLSVKNAKEGSSNIFLFTILRAAIKSFPLANLIDSLYIFKHPKYNFKFTDFRFGFLVLKEENKRSLSLKLISTSSIIYYLPLITITFSTFLTSVSSIGNSSSPGRAILYSSAPNLDFYQLFNIIFSNNLSLSMQLALGGLFFSVPSVLTVMSSSYLEGTILGPAIKSSMITFSKAVLPEFFPETFSYVLALTLGFLISYYVVSFIDFYIHGYSFVDWKKSVYSTYRLLFISIVSIIILLIMGATIESYFQTYIL